MAFESYQASGPIKDQITYPLDDEFSINIEGRVLQVYTIKHDTDLDQISAKFDVGPGEILVYHGMSFNYIDGVLTGGLEGRANDPNVSTDIKDSVMYRKAQLRSSSPNSSGLLVIKVKEDNLDFDKNGMWASHKASEPQTAGGRASANFPASSIVGILRIAERPANVTR